MNRGRINAYVELLFLLKQGPRLVTHLVYTFRTRHDRIVQFLSSLEQKGLVTQWRENRRRWFSLTENGRQAVEQIKQMPVLLEFMEAHKL